MAKTDAQKRAEAKYLREKTKQVMVKFYPADEDIYAWLDGKENRQGYIKDLIRRDMESGGGLRL